MREYVLKVYIVRHGESETNEKKQWTGWADVHLTNSGKEQAKKSGELLKGIPFDKIFTSDLARAKETAENAIPGCSYESSERLREINIGTLSYKPLSIITDEERKIIAQDGYVIFNGESKTDFNNRVRGFMKELESLDCENVAIFTHNGWLRTFLDTVLGSYIPRKYVCCNNCATGIFEYKDGNWKLFGLMNL